MSKSSNQPIHKTFEVFLSDRRYETGNLPGNLSYKSRFLEKGKMTKIPPSVTLTHQTYRHVDHLEFMNIPEIQEYVRYWQVNHHMVTQRCGWMYGYYIEDPNYEGGYRAVVEGIYEPPQKSVNDSPSFDASDEYKKTADQVAVSLGLELVGFIFTSLGRDADHLMTSQEVLRAAKMQLDTQSTEHYTRYAISKFVTCVTHPNMQEGGSPQTDAFMVSDQFCGMVRDTLVDPNPANQTNPKRVKLRDNLPAELLPQVLAAGKDASNEFDPDWFVVKVNSGAPVRARSFFAHSHFPRENRPDQPQVLSDIKRYFSKCSTSEPSWSKVADFHFLLYIARIFDIDTARVIFEAVRDRSEVNPDLIDLLNSVSES